MSVAFLLAAVRCASSGSFSSGQQAVPVISDPTGAIARAGDQEFTTPGSLLVPPGATRVEIRISKEGYETVTVILTPDSRRFRECFSSAVSPDNPNPPHPPVVTDSGIYALGARLLAILAGCSYDAGQSRLQPSLVLVKLEPLPQLPLAPPRNP